MSYKFLIVIAGPTAVGKTSVAIEIAKSLDTEIISCDSRQLYNELNIGVAKPTKKELAEVTHHFINHISIHEPFSAGAYEREALQLIEQLFESNKCVILAGGTGLYIKAILEGLDDFPEVDEADTNHYSLVLQENGIEALQNELKLKDPSYFREVDIHNTRRMIRALSVIKSSGQTFSSFRNSQPKERDFKVIPIHLTMDREKLYQRINLRVDQMIKEGLLDEVKTLVEHKDLRSLQTVGYSELFRYLDGELALDKAIELIKRNSRRYAKRQITWFNNNGDFIKVPSGDLDQLKSVIDTQVESIKSRL